MNYNKPDSNKDSSNSAFLTNEPIKDFDFECEYCGEEYQSSLRFLVDVIYIDESIQTNVVSCPDCISTFFTETPEEIRSIYVKKYKGDDY